MPAQIVDSIRELLLYVLRVRRLQRQLSLAVELKIASLILQEPTPFSGRL